MSLGQVAREGEQWDLAVQVFESVEALGVDDERAVRAATQVTQVRKMIDPVTAED